MATHTSSPAVEHSHAEHADTEAAARTVLELDSVTTAFEGEPAIEDVSLAVRDGELLSILGPSGCGKTTALRTIAGLEAPDSGQVAIGGERVADGTRSTPPEERDVGLVFQDFALFSHLSVAENVGFGIEDWPAAERAARIEELLDLVGLAGAEDRSPADLSGGQQQRVALARALAPEPALLLLDEPFSSLDRDLRERMREEVRDILDTAGVTTVFVTHDQTEALSISDRVAVLHDGRLEQVGHPEAVFSNPATRFVANFLGNPTFLAGQVEDGAVSTSIGSIPLGQLPGLSAADAGRAVDVILRPDDVNAVAATPDRAHGTVHRRSYEGSTIRYRVRLAAGTTVEVRHNHTAGLTQDDPVRIDLIADHEFAWFPAER
ncbi:ABC transporter ATP-binding protein [Halodesulfurarchaeum sp. HSR-GB]|uniref:ABC transporter ATP-binding protein n=1 Tax=Halodesulfurarchaeum sp. HSR-GB TaxID=3074077 RepID=UPI0028620487|nr:ABC transporter ATP-binding protein [Halodesulfurarchaeum sp. HSR-GB]MDR5656034.1 ABC transporter ATP-binding protein [Halodesulfurarchaeum sp. HSR-GB]